MKAFVCVQGKISGKVFAKQFEWGNVYSFQIPDARKKKDGSWDTRYVQCRLVDNKKDKVVEEGMEFFATGKPTAYKGKDDKWATYIEFNEFISKGDIKPPKQVPEEEIPIEDIPF